MQVVKSEPIPALVPWKKADRREKLSRWRQIKRMLSAMTPHERRKHWNMSIFGTKNDCGTIACAAGHASLKPWFRKRGFAGALVERERETVKWDEGRGLWDSVKVKEWFLTPANRRRSFGNMTANFFGIRGSEKIFFDATPRSVGKVIDEVDQHIKLLQKEIK